MLTVNADGHPVMGRFHRPGDEKRSVVVLPPEQFQIWLNADVNAAMKLCAVPADGTFTAEPAPQVSAGDLQRSNTGAQPSLF